MLVGMGAVLLTVFVNLALPHRIRLIGVALLVVPQIWLPGLPDIELATLAVVWTLTTCVAGLAGRGRSQASSPLIVIIALFVLVTAVSLLWALPSGIDTGAATVVRGGLFLLWLREAIVLARDEPRLLDTIVLWTVPGVALQSMLTIAFRISPALEEHFLRSPLASILVGRQAEHLFTDMRNNVLYSFKAGGVYVNGNVASLFGAIAALMLIVAARRTGRRWLYAIATLSFAGSIFSGSKTALVLGVGCIIATLFLPRMLNGVGALAAVGVIVASPLVFSVITDLLAELFPQFYADSDQSLAGREPLWKGAEHLFGESPFLGLGFGGWTDEMARFTDRPDLPPHNLLIAAWAYSGIFALAMAVVFMVVAITMGIRVVAVQRTLYDRRTAMCALYAIVWVFIHGMADNTSLYGEQRSMIFVGIAFGYLHAMKDSASSKDGSGCAIETNSRTADWAEQAGRWRERAV